MTRTDRTADALADLVIPQADWDRAASLIDQLTGAERRAMLIRLHLAAESHQRDGDDAALQRFARSVLATVHQRTTSPDYRELVAPRPREAAECGNCGAPIHDGGIWVGGAAIACTRDCADVITETLTVPEETDMDTCPGCVGRGTGTTCCSCSRPIPENLRTQTDTDSWTADCASCAAGRPHTHR